MEDVTRVLGAEGAGWPVYALGTTYYMTPPTLGQKSEFEAWLKAGAKKELAEMRSVMLRDEFAASMSHLATLFSSGVYRWGGPVYSESLNRGVGGLVLTQILLRQHHPTITREEVEAAVDDASYLDEKGVLHSDFGDTLKEILDALPNSAPPPALVERAKARKEAAGTRAATA